MQGPTLDPADFWRVMQPTHWPDPPDWSSVSTQLEIEECPRRWALKAAGYPIEWGGHGYPPKFRPASEQGTIIHRALELIMNAFVAAGIPSVADPRAVAVLKELGGYSKVIAETIETVLENHVKNPRDVLSLVEHRRKLLSAGRVMRESIQSILSNVSLRGGVPPARQRPSNGRVAAQGRVPLTKGSRTEVALYARRICWKGKADLVTVDENSCEIVDFKSGAFKPAHEVQIRTYAALWFLDDELNPDRRRADRLRLLYPNQTCEVPAPTEVEIDSIARDLVNRRQASARELAAFPPTARPSEASCSFCDVRQLCDPYWHSTLGAHERGTVDLEIEIRAAHGPASWDAVVIGTPRAVPHSRVLVRSWHQQGLRPGDRVRILAVGLAMDVDDATAPGIVTIYPSSEVYRLD